MSFSVEESSFDGVFAKKIDGESVTKPEEMLPLGE